MVHCRVDENGAIANSPIDSGDVEADAETTEERNARQEERRLMAMNSKYFADEEIKKGETLSFLLRTLRC